MSTTLFSNSPPIAPSASANIIVGGKASRLRALQEAGFNVPEFVVSPKDCAYAVSQLGLPVAVRSSASVEDGDQVSFAGQFESFLDLKSVSDVDTAIKRCHESVNSPSVKCYCEKHNIAPNAIRMEVIVQQMVTPVIAGVAFTVNPVTGTEEVLVEACEGPAENLLAGHESALPADHPVLQRYREQIESTANKIQQFFGAPQDVEFAIADDTVYVLQARPITRIGFSGVVGEWTNANFREGGVSSSVCSPLMWSLYKWIWDQTLKTSLRELKLYKRDFISAQMFFGRPYWNVGAVKEALETLPGFIERDFDQDLCIDAGYDGQGRTTPVTLVGVFRALPTLLSIKKFFRNQSELAEKILTQGLRISTSQSFTSEVEEIESFEKLIEQNFWTIESSYFRVIFASSLAKLDLISEFPDIDYKSLVADLPPLSHTAPVRAVQSLPNRSVSAIDEIIRQHPHHYRQGLDIIHPRWDEDREFVSEMLQMLPVSVSKFRGNTFRVAQERAIATLPRSKHRRFRHKLERLREFLWLREELRDLSNQIYYHIRKQALAIGDRRDLGHDIFFLTFQEIVSDHRMKLDERKRVYESYRNFRSPNEIGERHQIQSPSQQDDIRGIAASPGIVCGIAFVAESVEQANSMPAGQVLVCPYADPGWAPVLSRSAAVITESGGLLSHVAVICREFGIPAVLGVQDATRCIRPGDFLSVNGHNGIVEETSK